jgi:peptidyl-prolyl cis-trans isomerase C
MSKRINWVVIMMLLGLLSQVSQLAAEELAIVNNRVITREEFDQKLNDLPSQMKAHYMSSVAKQELLDNMITNEVVFQEAIRLGLDKDKDVVARLEEAKRQIMIRTMVDKFQTEKLSEDQVKKYYEAHKKDFKQVKASHILLDQEDKAKDVYKQLKNGADFAELAKKYSIDPSSKDKGGDLGYFTRGQMVRPFEEVAFSLKVNKFGEPVQTSFGYHIIKVVDIKDPKKYEEMTSEDINAVKQRMLNGEIERLKTSAKITVHKDLIK